MILPKSNSLLISHRTCRHPPGDAQVTPVSLLEAVQIGGVTIRRATLHSAGHFEQLNLKKGSVILLRRSGDVIPQVMIT